MYIYKRAQILIADIWSSFAGTSLGTFYDIDTITMFADYRWAWINLWKIMNIKIKIYLKMFWFFRVPQVLLYFEVLEYSQKLKDTLINGTFIMFNYNFF